MARGSTADRTSIDKPKTGAGPAVRRRRVFYIHGFDPRGPGPYHSLYQENAARASALNDEAITAGKRRRRDALAAEWSVTAETAAGQVETAYDFLRWDDLVRARWSKNELALLGELFAWTAAWLRLGFYPRARKQARALWLAMLSTPVVVGLFLLSGLIVVSLLGFLAGALAQAAGLPFWTGAIPALASVLLAPMLWRRLERWLNVCWLSRCFTYMLTKARGRREDLDARDAEFARRIAEAAADPTVDEVLVVGHSLGALHAVSTLARLLKDDPGFGADGRVALLTLGQPIAIFTVLPGAAFFRDDLAVLAQARQIPWVDVTSPSDPASACSLDIFHDIEAPPPGRVRTGSPRFHVYLEPSTFRAIRRDPIGFHFQYLRASDRPGGYDYFALTAGPHRLLDQPWLKEARA